MRRWAGVFSCISAVHVLEEAFSVFIVSCLLYLLSKFWVLEKDKIGSLVLLKGGCCGVIWEAGRREGRRFSEFLMEEGFWIPELQTTNRTHMLNENFLGLRRWEQ